jgi:hypothetical protein
MQERALRVGGTLTLSSSAFAGTEVELSIPGNIVFEDPGPGQTGLLGRLLRFLGLTHPRSTHRDDGP